MDKKYGSWNWNWNGIFICLFVCFGYFIMYFEIDKLFDKKVKENSIIILIGCIKCCYFWREFCNREGLICRGWFKFRLIIIIVFLWWGKSLVCRIIENFRIRFWEEKKVLDDGKSLWWVIYWKSIVLVFDDLRIWILFVYEEFCVVV